MAQLIISAAGAAIGSMIPGVGPMIGWAIGSALGTVLFPTHLEERPQSLMDLRVTGTEYGQPIPWVQGHPAIAGQVWWNTDRRPTTTTSTSGGKGEPEVTSSTTTYDMDMLLGLTDTVMIGISRIWWNGALIWTSDSGATMGSIAASSTTDKWTRMTVYTGAADQLPDPTYEAAVGSSAPAYRGRGSVFIQGLQLGQSGQLPNLVFEVATAGTITTPVTEDIKIGDVNFQITSSRDTYTVLCKANAEQIWTRATIATVDSLALIDTADGTVATSMAIPTAGGFYYIPTGVDRSGNLLAGTGTVVSRIYRFNTNGTTEYITVSDSANYGLLEDVDGNIWITNSGIGGVNIRRLHSINWAVHTCLEENVTADSPPNGLKPFFRNADGISGRIYGTIYSTQTIGYIDTHTMTVVDTSVYLGGASDNTGAVGADGNIYYVDVNGRILKKCDQDGVLLDSYQIPSGAGGSNDDWPVFYDSNGFLWTTKNAGGHPLYKVDSTTMELSASIVTNYCRVYGEPLGGVIAVYDPIATYGKLGLIRPAGLVTLADEDLADVVSRVCLRGGLTAGQIDVTALSSITKNVRALAVSQITAPRSTLEMLMAAFYFEMLLSEDKIVFVPRGGSSVASIPYADLGASMGGDQPDPLPLKEVNDLEIPAQIALTYINVNDDYQADTQYSDRLISATAGTTATVQMALGMTPAEAKGVAETMLLDQVSSRWSTSISLLGDYCRLEPTDVVTSTGPDGSTYRLRLVKKTDSYPLLTFDAVVDDVSVLTSQGTTSTDYTSSTVVSGPVNAVMELMDIPILLDAHDDPGFYVAAKGDGTPYSGSDIHSSPENTTYTLDAEIRESAVIGTCTTALDDWTGPRVVDELNSVTVSVGSGALSSSTRAAVLADPTINAMLIGSEIVQFVTATLVSPGVYTLTRFLRGSRGTEWAMTGHIANDRCVLLRNAGLRRIKRTASELGLSRYYKGVPLGRALSTATAKTFTDNGVGLKPFSVMNLRASVTAASGSTTLNWNRRTRLNTRLFATSPLGEESEKYEVDLFDATDALVLTSTVTEPQLELTPYLPILTFPIYFYMLVKAGTDYVGLAPYGNGPYNNYVIKKFNSSEVVAPEIIPFGDSTTKFQTIFVNGSNIYLSYVQGTAAGHVWRINSTTMTVDATLESGGDRNFHHIVFDGTSIWLGDEGLPRTTGDEYLRKLNATTLAIEASYALTGLRYLSYSAGSLWVYDYINSQIVEWGIAGTAEVQRIDCLSDATAIFVTNGLIYIASNDYLEVYNASTGARISNIALQPVAGQFNTGSGAAGFFETGSYVIYGAIDWKDGVYAGRSLWFLDSTTGVFSKSLSLPGMFVGSSGSEIFVVVNATSASDITTQVWDTVGNLTGYSATVYQISTTVGRGYGASLEL